MKEIDERIKELELKMTKLRKAMGVMYTMEMCRIDAQLEELHRLKRKNKENL